MDKYYMPSFCKKGKDVCNCSITCYPFLLFKHFKEESKIPSVYWESSPLNLPFKDENPTTYKHVMRYAEKIECHVHDGLGLYLYSIPTPDNLLGCGIGKTTTACALANHYLKKRIIQHIKEEKKIIDNPVLFLSVPKFQNQYNLQFSGNQETKEEAAQVFQNLLKTAMKTELLILDDIAVRGAETFLNFIYQIVDERGNENKTIFLTSNVSIEKTEEFLGDRICSRLQKIASPLGFKGKDHRKGLFT